MRSCWLHRANQAECILFFSGWGMPPEVFRFLPGGSHDVYIVHDYRELQSLCLAPFAGYTRLHLMAWSMGVWVAAHLLAGQAGAFATRTALGGTVKPVDRQHGIPPDRYAELADQFSQTVLEDFYQAMFEAEEESARFLASAPEQRLPDLHAELLAFRAAFERHGAAPDIFTRRIVTARDRIFSARNQVRSWSGASCHVLNWPHFPFFRLSGWADLL